MGKKSRRNRLKTSGVGGSGGNSRTGRPMPQTGASGLLGLPLDRAPDGKPVRNAAIMVAREDSPPLRCVLCSAFSDVALKINDVHLLCVRCMFPTLTAAQADFQALVLRGEVEKLSASQDESLQEEEKIVRHVAAPYCGFCRSGKRTDAANDPEKAELLGYKPCAACNFRFICPECFDDDRKTCMACNASRRSKLKEIAKNMADNQMREGMLKGIAMVSEMVASEEELRYDCRMLYHRRYREGKCSCCAGDDIVGGFTAKGTEPTGKRCGGCSAVWYCNETCQTIDWEVRREECAVMKKEREDRIAAWQAKNWASV